MAYLLGPKEKRSRAVGENLFLKAERSSSSKSAVLRKPYRPGIHGKARRSLSEYGLELREKQKAKLIYGVRERQFRKYYREALRHIGKTAEVLGQILETRLDSVVFRIGFAPSRSIARLLVSHGQILVNGRKQNLPSFRTRVGDKIALAPRAKTERFFAEVQNHLKRYDPPQWLELNKTQLEGKLARLPTLEDVRLPVDFGKIIEFYSR